VSLVEQEHVGAPGLPDAAARQAVAERLGQSVLLTAGAGAGKTTVLIGRIVGALVTGRVVPERLIAVTFTEAAAAELRRRLRQTLTRLADGQDPDEVPGLTAELPSDVAARAAAALGALDRAVVTTVHGCARHLLRTQPLAVGLPATFEVLDAAAARAVLDRQFEAAQSGLSPGSLAWEALVRSQGLGIHSWDLPQAFGWLSEHWDLLEDRPVSWPGPWPGIDLDAVIAPLRRAIGLAERCAEEEDRMRRQLLEDLPAPLARLEGAAGDERRALRALRALPRLDLRRGRSAAWGPVLGEVRDALAEAEAARTEQLRSAGRWCLGVWLAWLGEAVLQAADERRRRGTLTFHDLLVLARRLLRHHPHALRTARERAGLVVVDELQDTDPIQAELAVRLTATDPLGPTEDWATARVAPGRLVVVGDPAQSIYRFRRADLSVVEATGRVVGSDPLTLRTNFRSRPSLVRFVEAALGALVAEAPAGTQVAPIEAVAARTEGSRAPGVVVLGGPTPGLTRERRRQAASDLVGVLLGAVGRWPVGDEERPARPSDICILLPARTGQEELVDALEQAGLAYRLELGSPLYRQWLVRDVLAVLRCLADPGNPVATVGALRSELIGCPEEALLSFRQARGVLDCRVAPPPTLPADHPVVSALVALGELQGRCWHLAPDVVVDEVLERFGALERALAARRWREAWQRLRFLRGEAMRYQAEVGGDLQGFLAWVARREDEQLRIPDQELADGQDEAVRVMTVHGAKGLEFPIVAVLGFGDPLPAGTKQPVRLGADGLELRLGADWATEGFEAAGLLEQQAARAERVRLFYVACTRARDHLVLALHRPEKESEPSLATSVAAVVAQEPGLVREEKPQSPPARASGFAPQGLALGLAPGGRTDAASGSLASGPVEQQGFEPLDVEQLRVEQLRVEQRNQAAGGRVLTASDVAERLGRAIDLDGAGTTRRAGHRGGAALGRAVHRTVALGALGGRDLARLAREVAAQEGVGREHAEVLRLAAAALGDPEVARILAQGRCRREVHVAVPIGTCLLEGIADLLVEAPDGLHVVDLKTDRLEDQVALEAAVARYRPQLAAYSLAFSVAAGCPVRRASLLFLRAPDPDESTVASGQRSRGTGVLVRTLEGDELERAVAEVRGVVEGSAEATTVTFPDRLAR